LKTAESHLFHEEIYVLPPQMVVVTARPWHKILDEEKALLVKILGSVRVNINAISIVHQDKVSIESLKALNPGKVLVFGSDVQGDLKSYELVVVDGVSVIRADDFPALDDVRKKTLWGAMKQMFGV
jgi:hypothetical protein